MVDRRTALQKLIRVGPALALTAVVGFLLGACGGGGGGSALATRTGQTGTRPGVTATRTTPTLPAAPTPTAPLTDDTTTDLTTTEAETTTAETTTATPPVTVVTTETQTTTEVPTVPTTTTEPTTTSAETTTTSPATTATATTEPTSSESGTPWGWIAAGIAVLAGIVIGLLVWRHQRAGAAAWSGRASDFNRRCLIALDDVVAKGSVVTGQVEALAAEARSLESRAPDDPSKAAMARTRGRLDELAQTLESDRALRLASPPPSNEQLSYSTALVRQQVEQLQGVLRPPPPPAPGPPQ